MIDQTGTNLIPTWVDGTLRPMDKLAVHQLGLRHQAVSVFVMAGAHLLIQRRALKKYHTPGLWANTCCTHPLWGETPLDCAQRRLEEELGITGLAPQPRGELRYRADVGNGMTEDEVVEVFLATADFDLPVVANPAEVMDYRWIKIEDLHREIGANPDAFTPWLRIYLSEHHTQILG